MLWLSHAKSLQRTELYYFLLLINKEFYVFKDKFSKKKTHFSIGLDNLLAVHSYEKNNIEISLWTVIIIV